MKEMFLEMAFAGKSAKQIAAELQIAPLQVYRMAHKAGVKLTRAIHKRTDRAILKHRKMVDYYKQGATIKEVALAHGVSRQHVQNVLHREGCIRPRLLSNRMEESARNREARSLAKYGLPVETMSAHRKSGLLLAFVNQRNSAKSRGIAFHLRFDEWLAIWESSGHLDQRGRGRGRYVMSRYGDRGAYEVSNVFIQLGETNSGQGLHKEEPSTKPFKGVFCIYPGLAKPWLARFSKTNLGWFETAEEANAAREKYLRERDASHCAKSKSALGSRAIDRADA